MATATYPPRYPPFYPSSGIAVLPTAMVVRTSFETGGTLGPSSAGDTQNGMSYANNGRQLIIITNTSSSPGSCTVAFGYTVRGRTIPPITVTVPGNARVLAGPYDPKLFGDTVLITPSASTLTLDVLQPFR